jgi:Tfp pilus assembly protein PilN
VIGRLRLGVALRDHRLAVVALEGRRVRHAFTLEEPENPAGVLKGELDSRRIRARRAALGLPRTLAIVKRIGLPPAAGVSLAQMVGYELERHVPFPAEDAAFDFLPLPGPRGAAQPVLVVACERRALERALRLLEEARLVPASLTVACHDLPGLLGPRPRGERAVWVHLVGGEADLLFLEGRGLRLSRSVPLGGEGDLADEILRSLTHLGWSEWTGLWVSGDGAGSLIGSGALAPLGREPVPPPFSPRSRAALAGLGESAGGLALEALATARAPRLPALNLLPPALRPRPWSRAQWVTAANLVLATGLGVALLLAQGWQAERRLERVNGAIRALEPEVKAVERIAEDLERARRLLATLGEVEASSLRPLPILRELTELIPAEAWLTTLTLDSRGIELTGQATAANQLIPLLEGSPRLEKVEFASPVTRGRDKEQFRIRATWETRPGPQGDGAPAPAGARPGGGRTP